MNHVNAAILLVLSAVQSPPPAALASKVVSEDESLRGMSAMSVSVQVEGKLIDATATKANIETKLRQRGIRVLDRGLPQLHLQVDYMPTSDGRSTYATFAMRLEFAQALARPGGAALVEGVTWSDGAFGILGDDVTAKLEARASSMVGEFLGALLSVNPGLAKAAGAAGARRETKDRDHQSLAYRELHEPAERHRSHRPQTARAADCPATAGAGLHVRAHEQGGKHGVRDLRVLVQGAASRASPDACSRAAGYPPILDAGTRRRGELPGDARDS